MSKAQSEKMLECARTNVLAEREQQVKKGIQPQVGIEWRGPDKWVIVMDNMYVLNKKGQFEYEPMPSSRTDDFLSRTRFSFEEAWLKAECLIVEEGFRPVWSSKQYKTEESENEH